MHPVQFLAKSWSVTALSGRFTIDPSFDDISHCSRVVAR
jgi:hypothetical protein